MTKSRLLWFGLWIISLVLISFRGGVVSYGFFFFFTGLPIVTFLHLLLCLFQFRVYQTLHSRVITAGTPMKYRFVIENAGFVSITSIVIQMYPDFSYVEDLPSKTSFELLPGESYQFETNMICRYRGNYPVGIKSLVVTDFLRLWRLRYRIRSPFEAIVNTRVPSVNEFTLSDEFSVWQRQENITKKDEPDMVVRDYEAGDSFRRIHWNASAATGTLKTRGMTGEQQGHIALFFDTIRISEKEAVYLPSENKVLETVLFFAELYSTLSQSVKVCYKEHNEAYSSLYGTQYAMLSAPSDFEAFYQKIQTVCFVPQSPSGECIDFLSECRESSDSRRVILVMQTLTPSDAALIEATYRTGTDLMVCLISDTPISYPELVTVPVLHFSTGKEALTDESGTH